MVRPANNQRAKAIQFKRTETRNNLWPDSPNLVWIRIRNNGFTTIPRTLPLIALLFEHIATKGRGNPSGVYWDLWCRVFDEGFIEVTDEKELAYSSGYIGSRAVRSWQERVRELELLGFIRIQPKGNRPIGYILLINPYHVLKQLHAQGRISDIAWWNAFTARMAQIGAKFPSTNPDDQIIVPPPFIE